MKSVNWGRVILGGIAAGVVLNVSEFLLNDVVLKKANEDAMRALGRTMPESGGTAVIWINWGFLLGIVAVWLYAAIRPRYGAGAATAVRAGVAIWIISPLFSSIVFWNLELFPVNPVVLVWTLFETVLATLVGAWLYREESS